MKNISCVLAIVFLILQSPPSAHSAQPWQGMDIVQYCTGDAVVFNDAVCRAYIQGITDAHEYYQLKGKHSDALCLPSDKKQRAHGESKVPEWLAVFNEKLHRKPIVLMVDALGDIFPCPTPSKN